MSSTKQEIISRFKLVYIAVVVFAILIVFRLFHLQIAQKDRWKKKGQNIEVRKVPAARGNIFADDGRLMAISVPYYKLSIDLGSPALNQKAFAEKVDSLAICLAEMFGDKTPQQYSMELRQAHLRKDKYHVLQKKVSFLQLEEVKKFPLFRLGKFKSGMIVEKYSRRILPHGKLAARTIGYSERSVGIEGAFDHVLKGSDGMQLMQRLPGNDRWMPLNFSDRVEPQNGKDVVTTIDLNLQDVAENALQKQLKLLDADHGTAVLMEVQTGEIKAIANLTKDKDGHYIEDYNYAAAESAEPGSTFKLASLIAVLEDGYVKMTDYVNTGNGIIKYNGFPIRDSHRGGYGTITVQRALELSSNVGISKIIYQNYKNQPEKFVNRLYSMNLGDKLNITLEGEGKPYIKYPGDKYWSSVSLPQMSIGYEVQLTPLHTLTFYNAIANGGKMVKPRFVKEIRQNSRVVQRFETQVLNASVCSKQTIEKVVKALQGVVLRGTATNLRGAKYSIAGKTGTAQIANTKYGYINAKKGKSYQASFVGFFPAEKPKFTCIVVINSPARVSYYGASAAGPVFREIADKAYASCIDMHREINSPQRSKNLIAKTPYSKSGNRKQLDIIFEELNIPVKMTANINSDWVLTRRHEKYIQYQTRKIEQGKVPYVVGMGAKDALFLLESAGLKVEIKGRGMVKSQSIKAGTPAGKGKKIVIELS